MGNVSIHLTGGLGNQLFQYAAALSLVDGESNRLDIEQKLGKPRGALKNNADIFGFTWPKPLNVIEASGKTISKFMSRVTGYCLRLGVTPSNLESKRFVKTTLLFLASILVSIFFKKKKNVVIGTGLGYSKLNSDYPSPHLVGYFQSYKYAAANREYLMKAKIQNVGPELKKLDLAAKEERPLVVHLRFGDYLLNENFGMPSREYYLAGINSVIARGSCKSIWVFSDDLHKAKQKLELKETLPIRWINSVDDCVAATLQAMRLGRGYVIANSTYSWWAAFLSLNPGVEVVAPTPWFMGLEDPKELIPPDWKQLDARYLGNH